jgi:hypothetical protein
MYGAPAVTRALNLARGVHTLRPPTARSAPSSQCLQETAETITAIAANRANWARRAGAVEHGVAVLPDLLPGDKCMFYQPALGA